MFYFATRPSPDICSEFEIEQAQISVSAGDEISTHFRALPTASILLFIMSVPGNLLFHGAADVANDLPPSVSVCEGSVVFLPANVSAKVAMAESAGGSTAHIVYRTHVNMAIFDK